MRVVGQHRAVMGSARIEILDGDMRVRSFELSLTTKPRVKAWRLGVR